MSGSEESGGDQQEAVPEAVPEDVCATDKEDADVGAGLRRALASARVAAARSGRQATAAAAANARAAHAAAGSRATAPARTSPAAREDVRSKAPAVVLLALLPLLARSERPEVAYDGPARVPAGRRTATVERLAEHALQALLDGGGLGSVRAVRAAVSSALAREEALYVASANAKTYRNKAAHALGSAPLIELSVEACRRAKDAMRAAGLPLAGEPQGAPRGDVLRAAAIADATQKALDEASRERAASGEMVGFREAADEADDWGTAEIDVADARMVSDAVATDAREAALAALIRTEIEMSVTREHSARLCAKALDAVLQRHGGVAPDLAGSSVKASICSFVSRLCSHDAAKRHRKGR